MGLLIILQVALDLGFIAVVSLLLMERSKMRNAEDPRLSRGLQLLSSKIAILQDLMDRSEVMARQLSQMIDKKQLDVQDRIEEVEMHLHRVQSAIEKSEEVAKIFQDRIPHEEIIERQTTMKYLQAAKLAHQGLSVDEIAGQLDIPRGELELIVKVNRSELRVSEAPAWAVSELQRGEEIAQPQTSFQNSTLNSVEEFENETVVTQGAPELPRNEPAKPFATTVKKQELQNKTVFSKLHAAQQMFNEVKNSPPATTNVIRAPGSPIPRGEPTIKTVVFPKITNPYV